MVYVILRCDHGYNDAFGLEFIDCTGGGAPFRSYIEKIIRQYWNAKLGIRLATFRGQCQLLTARSCACSGFGPRRPFNCSGLGVDGFPPCKEVMELLTLLEGVVVLSAACCGGIRPFAL